MNNHIFTTKAARYTRITKAQARKRFNANETFQICPSKLIPGGPWAVDMLVDPAHIKAERSTSPTYPTPESFFDATVCEFCYYNASSHDTGTYAAFYVMELR